jgi:hypothetical protein
VRRRSIQAQASCGLTRPQVGRPAREILVAPAPVHCLAQVRVAPQGHPAAPATRPVCRLTLGLRTMPAPRPAMPAMPEWGTSMAAPEPSRRAPRSWFVPCCASFGLSLCLLFAGCLNPRPEDFPSARDQGPDDSAPGPVVIDQPPATPAVPVLEQPGSTPVLGPAAPPCPCPDPDNAAEEPVDAGAPQCAPSAADSGTPVAEPGCEDAQP